MVKRHLPIAISLLALASSASAGGDSRAARIIEFIRASPSAATFVVEGTSEEMMPGCRRITVVARYSLWTWPWAKPTVTRDAHERALDQLYRDFSAKSDTRFGLMGSGLGDDSAGGACHFRSRAVAVLEEFGGRKVVYSFFKD